MKTKCLIKSSTVKIISAIVIVTILYIGHSYGFFKYCTKLSDKDFRNVYGIACRNTDIFYQRVEFISIDNERITVCLKRHTIPYDFLGFDPHPSDFYSAVNIYRKLATQFKGRIIEVYTGATGSSDDVFKFNNDKVWIDTDYYIGSERMLTFSEILLNVIDMDNISEIASDYTIDSVSDELPVNYNIDSFRCLSDYSGNLSAISSFQGLKNLNIYFTSDKGTNYVNMEFLNDLPLLEDLTLTADCTYLDFAYVQNKNVENITFYTDNCTNEYKEKLSYAFPDAQINIISSD